MIAPRVPRIAVVSFAASQGSRVIAEGIENNEMLQAVLEVGVSLGQGYLLGRPMRKAHEDPSVPVPSSGSLSVLRSLPASPGG